MAIDALVAYVEHNEDGSGTLHLCDRIPNGSRGQSRLHFADAPHEVTSLNGLALWGGDRQIMLGDTEIARRDNYTRITFVDRDAFVLAVRTYRQRKQPPQPGPEER